MYRVKEITSAGGACPYQCEGVLEDGQLFYLRYRDGHLRFGIGKTFTDCIKNYVYVENIGEELDGWPNHELFAEKLKDIVKFPDDFRHEFRYYDIPYDTEHPELSDFDAINAIFAKALDTIIDSTENMDTNCPKCRSEDTQQIFQSLGRKDDGKYFDTYTYECLSCKEKFQVTSEPFDFEK